MTQSALNRSVARATGESVGVIRKLGFSLLHPPAPKARKRERRTPPGKSRTQPCDRNNTNRSA